MKNVELEAFSKGKVIQILQEFNEILTHKEMIECFEYGNETMIKFYREGWFNNEKPLDKN